MYKTINPKHQRMTTMKRTEKSAMIQTAVLAVLVLAAGLFLSGCAEETVPEINDENCGEVGMKKNLAKLKNKEIRDEFLQRCIYRPE